MSKGRKIGALEDRQIKREAMDAFQTHMLSETGIMTKYYMGVDPYGVEKDPIVIQNMKPRKIENITKQPAVATIIARKKKEDKKKESSFSIFSFFLSPYKAIYNNAKLLKNIGNVKSSKLNFKNK